MLCGLDKSLLYLTLFIKSSNCVANGPIQCRPRGKFDFSFILESGLPNCI